MRLVPGRDQIAAYKELPGSELVARGVRDLEAGVETVPAMLVSMAAPRLREVGIEVPRSGTVGRPSERLYRLLAHNEPDSAHGRYNALVRRVVSFARSAESASGS